MLKKIEELREGSDLNYIIYGNFIGSYYNPSRVLITKPIGSQQTSGRISKSDWVEKFLSAFDYKEVSLLEIPKLGVTNYQKIIDHLDSAWKQKQIGQYDKVLTDCRKVIEEISTTVRKLGFETKDEKENKVPDWKKFFGSGEEIGEIFGTINQKLYGFTWFGAHTGKSVNLEDAEYALMITHAIANMVIKKIS